MTGYIHKFKDSSFIDSCHWDKDLCILTIMFKNGTEYKYSDVPKNVYDDFKTCDSAGQFFGKHIKGKFNEGK